MSSAGKKLCTLELSTNAGRARAYGQLSAHEQLELLENTEDEHHVRSEPQVVRERALVEGEGALERDQLRRRVGAARVAAGRRVVQPRAHDVHRVDAQDLGCQGTRCVRYGRGWYAYPVRTVRGALGASGPAPPVRTQGGSWYA